MSLKVQTALSLPLVGTQEKAGSVSWPGLPQCLLPWVECGPGFLNLGTIGMWGRIILCCGALSGVLQHPWSPPTRCLVASLPPAVTTNNVSRHCQGSLRGQNHPELGPLVWREQRLAWVPTGLPCDIGEVLCTLRALGAIPQGIKLNQHKGASSLVWLDFWAPVYSHLSMHLGCKFAEVRWGLEPRRQVWVGIALCLFF